MRYMLTACRPSLDHLITFRLFQICIRNLCSLFSALFAFSIEIDFHVRAFLWPINFVR